jgi:hypothetical protein
MLAYLSQFFALVVLFATKQGSVPRSPPAPRDTTVWAAPSLCSRSNSIILQTPPLLPTGEASGELTMKPVLRLSALESDTGLPFNA